MAFADLREFLRALAERGHLSEVSAQVDWNEEIGAIAEEAVARRLGALLFTRIRDHDATHGRRLAVDVVGSWERLALALGVPEATAPADLIGVWRRRVRTPVPPRVVSDAPCQDVVHTGADVDLGEFPAPKLHALDGGRYLLTWHIVVTKDPDSGWTNLGTYRGMILDRRSVGLLFQATRDCGLHAQKYAARGEAMPVAVALGLDPVAPMVACAPLGPGEDEYAVMGGLREEPVELVRCRTLDLYVPARSEIVLEGTLRYDPEAFRLEGPFGEYPGHYTSVWAEPRPVLNVQCITHRRDPIAEACTVGLGPWVGASGGDFAATIARCAQVWDYLDRAGVPGVAGVWCDPETQGTHLFVKISTRYYGHARQVAAALWGAPFAIGVGKCVVVTDDDVDITDLAKVNAAIAFRCRGGADLLVFPGSFGGPLDPSTAPEVKRATGGMGRWDRVLVDATWPVEWEPRPEWGGLRHPPACVASPETRARVRARWSEYGFGAGARRIPETRGS